MSKVFHTFSPIFDENSEILILGSMPSVASRENGFYYGHPRNRFWKILSDIYCVDLTTKEDRVAFLHKKHIALWDVIASCDIEGSRDHTICNVVCNDICGLLKKTKIKFIFSTGKKATLLYNRYIYPQTKIKTIYLPSSSPANQSIKYEEILESYQQLKICSIKKI